MYYPWDKVAKKTYEFINSGKYNPDKILRYGLATDSFSQYDCRGDAVVWLPQDQKDFEEFFKDKNFGDIDRIRWIHVRMHNSFEQNKIKF